jgi:hypothetical protein
MKSSDRPTAGDNEGWKMKFQATMRCVVEAIFSRKKRRFGEYLFSINITQSIFLLIIFYFYIKLWHKVYIIQLQL